MLKAHKLFVTNPTGDKLASKEWSRTAEFTVTAFCDAEACQHNNNNRFHEF